MRLLWYRSWRVFQRDFVAWLFLVAVELTLPLLWRLEEDVVWVGVGDGSRSRAEGLVLLVAAICSGAASCVFGACVEGAIFGLAWIFSSAWFLVRGGCWHG
ncbi:MAG: hypothetical protein KatS3mg132_642 [Limisphaera sp.]|nr:MAG: hypothetical protein KatS3mg132_642 [Limisphaera sp.]